MSWLKRSPRTRAKYSVTARCPYIPTTNFVAWTALLALRAAAELRWFCQSNARLSTLWVRVPVLARALEDWTVS